MIQKLEDLGTYDTTKLYFAGCSFGSAFSQYSAVCMKKAFKDSVTAFSTHSTGLKVKGDGLHFPPDIYDTSYVAGECPNC
mmetsp:Transcript_5799/g.8741  ORF Transcript_5799/g.8741 Transcript_5799/m.8741 type:complete len:80 (-) Transcript_5799:294-533(-)